MKHEDEDLQVVKVDLLRMSTNAQLGPPPEPTANKSIIKFLKEHVSNEDWEWQRERDSYMLIIDSKPLLEIRAVQFKNSRLTEADVDRYKNIIKTRITKLANEAFK